MNDPAWMRRAEVAARRLGAATVGKPRASHHVYVVLLHDPRGVGRFGLYVGQTSRDPDWRFDQHKSVYKASNLGNDARGRDILFEEGYALALPEAHPLANRKTLEPEEVANAEMIVRRNCEALLDVSRFFTQRGVRPFFAARTTNDDRAIALVRVGLGITVMPRCFAQPGIAMPALAGFDQRRRIGLLVAPDGAGRIEDSQCLARFSAAIRAAASAMQ